MVQQSFPFEHITESGRHTFTTAVLRATTKPEIQKLVEDYIRAYPPMGYATRIVSGPHPMEHGAWEAILERYSSCD